MKNHSMISYYLWVIGICWDLLVGNSFFMIFQEFLAPYYFSYFSISNNFPLEAMKKVKCSAQRDWRIYLDDLAEIVQNAAFIAVFPKLFEPRHTNPKSEISRHINHFLSRLFKMIYF
jgi:hypothetical protein